MELKDFISELVKNYDRKDQPPFGMVDNTLYGKKDLEPIKDKILQFPEFSGLSSLEIIDYPTFETGGRMISVPTYRLSDVSSFKGNGYILSLALTPEMYDPKTLHNPIKDGAAITPALYNPLTFEPKKKIVLEFSPEMAQDLQMANGEAILRQHLHDLLDKVLDNPEDYLIKGERAVLVRGFFDDFDGKKQDIPPLSVVKEEPKYKLVFYMSPVIDSENGETINMELKRKYIPIELEDEFMKLFEEKIKNLSLTESEIDKFLEENKK